MTTTVSAPVDTAAWQPVIKDADLGLAERAVESWQERHATRGIIRDGDKIALLHLAGCNYYKLPGGGIEGNENVLAAFQREAMEEVGCEVAVQFGLGEVCERRSHIALYQTSEVMVANKVGGVSINRL